MCVHCKHELAVKDLIPVFSWIALKGKCRYCSKQIPSLYPIVEISTAILFIVSYIFWPNDLADGGNIVFFIAWLASVVGLNALFLYDLKYLILPNKIVFPVFVIGLIGIIAQSILQSDLESIKTAIYGVLIGGGIFYLLFQLSSGKWIGGGDVKLGFALGLIVGGPSNALLLLFIASSLGSIYSIPQILKKNIKVQTKIAFGPFLITAAVIVQLFGQKMIDWYINTLSY